MYLISGILLTLAGLGSMGFGVFLFYALLPLFYALFGVGVGYEFGSFLTGAPEGEMSLVKLVFAIGGGILFAGMAHFLEPFRRVLIGLGLGSLIGGLIASALGITGAFAVIIMFIGAAIGAGLTVAVFDRFIIVASAFGGAGLAMDGLHLIFQSVDILDRGAIQYGVMTPLIIWIATGTLAMGWQLMNIQRWKENL
jgi:hypothetical protein